MAAYTSIDDPSVYFQTVLYTGNGGTGRNITLDGNSDLQPDWIWIKSRSVADAPIMFDSVRGATKRLIPSAGSEESTETQEVSAFNTDGFTIGNSDNANKNTATFVAWNWKAGTSFTNDASATSIGTIDSTGSASNTSGFSVVSYTGTGSSGTIKHGLSTAPSMVIIKNRSHNNKSWIIAQKSIGYANGIFLNLSDAKASETSAFNSTAPTSSVFTVGTTSLVNDSGDNYIAYCFADVKGYSKFGKYTGNANVDGPMIYTGFRPSYVLIKNAAASEHWRIYDNKRDTFNHMYHVLFANEASAESTVDNASEEIDFLSNGIKIRSSAQQLNGSGQNLVYMAFAESPFVNSSGVPNNGR